MYAFERPLSAFAPGHVYSLITADYLELALQKQACLPCFRGGVWSWGWMLGPGASLVLMRSHCDS